MNTLSNTDLETFLIDHQITGFARKEDRFIIADLAEDRGDAEASEFWRAADRKRLDELPKTLRLLLPRIRDKWIEICLGTKTNRKLAEQIIDDVYLARGLEPAQKIWKRSPLEGANSVYDPVYDFVRDSVRDSVWASVLASVWASVRDSVRASVYDSVRDSVWDSVWDSVLASVRDSVWASVWDSVQASVRDSVRDSVYDSNDAHWLAFYTVFRLAGIRSTERLLSSTKLASCCGWWWPFRDVVILTDLPVEIEMIDGKLKYLRYADGFYVKGS